MARTYQHYAKYSLLINTCSYSLSSSLRLLLLLFLIVVISASTVVVTVALSRGRASGCHHGLALINHFTQRSVSCSLYYLSKSTGQGKSAARRWLAQAY